MSALKSNKQLGHKEFLWSDQDSLGQRVENWNVEAETGGQWQRMAEATTIGFRRILKFEPITTTRVRINILESRACPVISTLSLY